MIRLHRPAIPLPLARRRVAAARKLWAAWRAGHDPEPAPAVYAHPEVKRTLREAQDDKCAYCETCNPGSHEVVEHYRPKMGWRQEREHPLQAPGYFWLAYEWENLLFACDRCNDRGHKQNLFPLVNPTRRATAARPATRGEEPLLIDPYITDPEQHIGWDRDVPRERDGSPSGRTTIAVCKLAADDLMTMKRRGYLEETEKFLDWAELFSADDPVREEMRPVFLGKIGKDAPWSAMVRANLGARIHAL